MKQIIILCMFLLSQCAYAQVNKWVDSEGKVVYSDQPPPVDAKQVSQDLGGQLAGTREAPNKAGKIELIEGDIKVVNQSGQDRIPSFGDTVYEGETVISGKESEAHIAMEDGGFIAIRSNTQLKIATYRANGGADDRSIINLLKGTFRSVTGWIGKYNNKNYAIKTPTATIGVRGTDHEPTYVPEDSAHAEPGTYDKVNEGESVIENEHGTSLVKASQSGFVAHHGKAKPLLLNKVPSFFRASRNDHIVEKRREMMRERLQQHREERKKAFATHQAELKKEQYEKNKQQREERLKHYIEKKQQLEAQHKVSVEKHKAQQVQQELRQEKPQEERQESKEKREKMKEYNEKLNDQKQGDQKPQSQQSSKKR